MNRRDDDPGQMNLPAPVEPAAAPGATRAAACTVSHLTRLVKDALEGALTPVWIVGEISNFKRHASGHLYLTLKDEHAALAAVMWGSRAALLKFAPRDGMKVLAQGRVGVYEPRGVYQLYIERLEPHGVGEQQAAFQQLVAKLRAEGLFDPARKRPPPALPRTIGVVTSPAGAALRDLIQVIHRRCPIVRIVVHPARVQGDGAAEDIAAAIDGLNGAAEGLGGIDVLIVGRGGGSVEDLWAFNEECVARAIFRSTIPVISAVGHETDVTLADLTADRRSATPTAAGEAAVPVLAELLAYCEQLGRRMAAGVSAGLAVARKRWEALLRRRPLVDPTALIKSRRQRLDELSEKTVAVARRGLVLADGRLAAAAGRLEALSPLGVLARGYAIARRADTGVVVRRSADVRVGDGLRIRLGEGEIDGTVTAKRPIRDGQSPL